MEISTKSKGIHHALTTGKMCKNPKFQLYLNAKFNQHMEFNATTEGR